MHNPEHQLKEYLAEIKKKVLWLISKKETYWYLRECENTPYSQVFDSHPAFWGNVITALDTDLFVNLATLYDERSERNLVDYLKQVKMHCGSLVSDSRLREFEAAIDEQMAKIADAQNIVGTLKTHRDKYYAHWDKRYFGKSDRLTTEHPLNVDELSELIDTAREIVRKQYSFIFKAHLDSSSPVNSGDVKTVVRNLMIWPELVSKIRESSDGEKYLQQLLIKHLK